MVPAQLVVFIEKQAGKCMTPSPSKGRSWSQKEPAACCVCTCGKRPRHFIEDMKLWDQTTLWNLSTIKTEHNEVHVPTASANDESTCRHWSLSSFLQRLITPLDYQPPVISTWTGVVATWCLGKNLPTLWLERVFCFPVNALTLYKLKKLHLFSLLFSCFNLGGLGALFGGA